MAILRAGPFATSSDSFVDLENDITDQRDVFPVNCNNYATNFWEWRARVLIVKDTQTLTLKNQDDGLFEINESSTSDDFVVEVQFCYQAVNAWSFSGSSYLASAEDSGASTIVVFVGFENEVFSDTDISEEFGQGTQVTGSIDSIVFPPAVLPQYVRILLQCAGFFGFSKEIRLNLPINT
jgi:hypothetical protein